MKLRVMGTVDECKQAQEFFRALGQRPNVKYCTVSGMYANRGSVGYYRVYIEIEHKTDNDIFGNVEVTEIEQTKQLITPPPKALRGKE